MIDVFGYLGDAPALAACEISCADQQGSDHTALAACLLECASKHSPPAAPPEKKPPETPFPWGPVIVGGAVLLGAAYFAFGKPERKL